MSETTKHTLVARNVSYTNLKSIVGEVAPGLPDLRGFCDSQWRRSRATL